MTVIFSLLILLFIINPRASILGMQVLGRIIKRNWIEFLKQFRIKSKAKVKVD